jgi:hypothetical protein
MNAKIPMHLLHSDNKFELDKTNKLLNARKFLFLKSLAIKFE